MNPVSIPVDQLLSRTTWMRGLARHLLDDPHDAEDAVQDAVVSALEQPGDRVRDWSAWLSRVVRRTALRRRRGEVRRRQREVATVTTAESPATDELVARAALQRQVVGFVLQLGEPYRSAILLRYWEDLRPRQVAARLGVPLDTVYSRLQRGLALLRGQLEGERDDWRRALLPFAFASVQPWSAVLSALTMSIPAKIAVGATCALVAFAFWSDAFDAPSGAPSADPPTISAEELKAGAELETGAAVTAPGSGEHRVANTSVDEEFTVRGHVRRFRGQALSGVRLRARLYHGYEQVGAPVREDVLTTGADGGFAWRLPPPGRTVLLQFNSGDESVWHGYGRKIVIRGQSAPNDVAVQGSPMDVWIEGRVLDPAGNPLADAWVRNPFAEREVRSGSDGGYVIQSSSVSSNAVLFCRCDGFAIAKAEIGTGSESGRRSYDFHLQPGLVVHGKVIDTAGEPIVGVDIRSSPLFGSLGESNAEGEFSLASMDPTKETLHLWFHHRSHLSKHVVLQSAAAERPLVVTLARGVRVDGHVFGPDGAPVAGAKLRIARPQTRGVATLSRDDGSFVLLGASRGELQLVAEHAGMARAVVPVNIADDAEEVGPVVVRMGQEQFLAGQIVDDLGKPIGARGGVAAFVGSQPFLEGGRTDAEGRFRLVGLPPGQVRLEVFGSGLLRREVASVQVGQEGLQIVLQRSAGFAGRVVDAETGTPIERFTVRIVNSARRLGEKAAGSYAASWSEPGMSFQTAKGTWSTAEIGSGGFVPGGLLGLEITAKGYAPHLDRRVSARVDPDPAGFEVRLGRAGVIRGRVVIAATGVAVAGATVRVTSAERPLRLVGNWYENNAITARTGADGRFAITGAPLGEVSLRVEHVRHPWQLDDAFVVRSGVTTERLIQLAAGGVVSGTAPSPGVVHVHAVSSAVCPDFHAEVRTDARGGFVFAQPLAPGRYRVFALTPDDAGHVRWTETLVRVAAGGAHVVVLRPGGTGGLRGKLRSRWRKGRFRPEGDGPWVEVPLRDGWFEVRGLPAGRFDVHTVGVVDVKAGRVVEAVRK